MNLIEPTTSFLTAVVNSLAASFGSLALFANDSPDGGLGVLMSGLAGVAAALAVALLLAVYFRSGYRSARDMIRHGLAAAAVLGLLAFAAYDMRHAALDYLGVNPSKPEAGFEIEPSRALAPALVEHRIAEAT